MEALQELQKLGIIRKVRIGIFSPYLDTLGGGEKYVFKIAECLSRENEVCIFWDKVETLPKGSNRFGIDLSNVKTTPNIFNRSAILNKFIKTKNYDLIIYLSDGSIPALFANKNFLIFQFPVNWVNTKSIINKLKLSNISGIICYSEFVKNYLEKSFSNRISVLAPPVDIITKKNQKKENLILSVGRFTQGMNRKKQEVLVEIFKQIYKNNKTWKLVLIGGILDQDEPFVESLKKQASGFPIDIFTNAPLKELREFYLKSKIYWHATGFGENLDKHPELAEHFGITTVEAMSAGTVPVVINAGGQKEIVVDGESGFLWSTEQELIDKTKKLIGSKELLEKLSDGAIKRSGKFTGNRFCKDLYRILEV